MTHDWGSVADTPWNSLSIDYLRWWLNELIVRLYVDLHGTSFPHFKVEITSCPPCLFLSILSESVQLLHGNTG